MKNFDELKRKLTELNQLHLIQYWDELTANEQDEFVQHLNNIDLDHAIEQYRRATNLNNNKQNNNGQNCDNSVEIEAIPTAQIESEENLNQVVLKQYERLGLEAIGRNEIGVLLMAGGQGTRLGVKYPKGMYPIQLPSKKTLLQLQAERIQRLQQLSRDLTGLNGKITWYIMTSESTDLTTKQYLKQHDYFGLNPADVVLFQQGQLPCFDFNGRIILEAKDRCALSPDGNGGLYRALSKNSIIADIRKRGVRYLHAYSIDNILIKVADPVFLGYCLSKKTDCGVKAVIKSDPNEPIGVICKIKDRNCYKVVEYSEISAELRQQRHPITGNLTYNCGNICNHFFTTEFLQRIVDNYDDKLTLHVAKKKIPYYDGEVGKTVNSRGINGIKIEKFIFDVFEFSENFVIWQVPRFKEFSPIKNCDDLNVDCPKTARFDLLNLHKFYVEQAGGVVENSVEISPLLSYAGENLDGLVNGRIFDKLMVLWGPNEVPTETLSWFGGGGGGGSSSMTLAPPIMTIEKVPKEHENFEQYLKKTKQTLIYSPKLPTKKTQTTPKDLKPTSINDKIDNNDGNNHEIGDNDKRYGSKRKRRKQRDHSVLPQQQQQQFVDPETQIEQINDDSSMKIQNLNDFNDEKDKETINSKRLEANQEIFKNSSYLDWEILRQLRSDLDETQIENEFNFKRIALEEALKTLKTGNIKSRLDCVELECLKKEFQSNNNSDNDNNAKKIDFYLKLPRKFSRANVQFEFPFDRQSLEKMSPLQYLKNHVVVAPSKKFLYRCVYDKILFEINESNNEKNDDANDGDDNRGCKKQRYLTTSNLFPALDIMMGKPLTKQQKTNFLSLLDLHDFDNATMKAGVGEGDIIDFQQFCGICGLCERIFASEFDPKFPSRLLDPPNEIEIADFQALPRKLSGLNLNGNLLEILNKINTS